MSAAGPGPDWSPVTTRHGMMALGLATRKSHGTYYRDATEFECQTFATHLELQARSDHDRLVRDRTSIRV